MRFLTIVVLTLVLFSVPTRADQFADVKDAINRQDYQTAVKILQSLAASGDEGAQISLGTLYYYGLSVPQDYGAAIRLWRPLAEKGIPRAEYAMGILYFMGKGVPLDSTKALEYFQKAGEHGLSLAQTQVCAFYLSGMGTKMDWPKAMNWCHKAADQGDSLAMLYLGHLYQTGIGVEQNNAEAYYWYSLGLRTAEKDLTPEQKAAVEKRISEWKPTPTPATTDAIEKRIFPPPNIKAH